MVDATALVAFESARDESAPIAPTLRLTFSLADRLRKRSILRLLDVPPRTPGYGQARAIYDPVAWEYLADPPEVGALLAIASAQLKMSVAAALPIDVHWLWHAIAEAELESYAAHLLRRHQMDGAWVRPILERTESELAALSLAQRRALLWFGIREGAASFLSTRGDAAKCVEAIVCEVRRQARWTLRHEPQATSWLPQSSGRQPLLLATFLGSFPLGNSYWTEVPTLDTVAKLLR